MTWQRATDSQGSVIRAIYYQETEVPAVVLIFEPNPEAVQS